MKVLRKITCCIFVIALIVNLFPCMIKAQAATPPSQVTNVNAVRISKNTAKISWDYIDGATGYQVFAKKGNGKYKLMKTSKVNVCEISKLNLGSKYVFKVRAYKTSKKKKVFGAYSNTVMINMAKSVYLVDVADCYSSDYFVVYKNTSFDLSDGVHSKGLYTHNSHIKMDGGTSYAKYNLEGKYSKLSFYQGSCASSLATTITVFCDGEQTGSYFRSAGASPSLVELDVTGVYDLHIIMTATGDGPSYSYTYIGMGEMKLTY